MVRLRESVLALYLVGDAKESLRPEGLSYKLNNVAFAQREIPGLAIQFSVRSTIFCEELSVCSRGIPEIDGEVHKRAGGIPPELSAPKMGIASEEPDLLTFRSVDSLKAAFTSRLDFELPEDYKDSCPIFCSR
jgi:hypothetical protein